ncbi:MAG: hypothetical protein EPO67_07880 [Reyranella sp.]|nr:MAG: hypothetical protein EPO67_07880 [Reyranella sp.]
MVNRMTTGASGASTDTDREDILKEIALKWSKFSRQELVDTTTNDELVEQIMAKYGSKKAAAQREVDILMDGRNLTPRSAPTPNTASSRL